MNFYHNEMIFEVPDSVYYPREDSELMAKVLEKTNIDGKTMLEIGCGCGLLSIIMAKAGAKVTAADINPEAVEATKTNAGANGVDINAIESDLFSNVNNSFDMIIFNPPYLPVEDGETDPTYAGGESGRMVIEKFVAKVKGHLNSGGCVLLLISSLTGEKETIELFEKEDFKITVVAREKIPWEELIVICAE